MPQGLGLLPWRLIDWYHASIILHYAKVTWRRRAKRHLSPLEDPNDLPDPDLEKTDEPAATKEDVPEGDDGPGSTKNADQAPQFEHSALAGCTVVLNDKQLARLRQAQSKLSKSQTWYRPHATPTHHVCGRTDSSWLCSLTRRAQAFPIKWMVIILTLNVGNSLFQIGLCCVMWIFRYYNRPAVRRTTSLAPSPADQTRRTVDHGAFDPGVVPLRYLQASCGALDLAVTRRWLMRRCPAACSSGRSANGPRSTTRSSSRCRT